jgi:DNA replication protein DnaC
MEASMSELELVKRATPFEEKLAYWETIHQCGILPQGYRTRNLAQLPDSEEKKILMAYDEGEDEFGFLLQGQAGVGKTFILTALMNKILRACDQYECSLSEYVLYFPIGYLLFRLRTQRNPEEFSHCIRRKFLFLDDLGTENTTDFAREHFFTILDMRCQKKLPTFISTNLNMNELKEKYGERIVSRLKEMCIPLTIKGEDKRTDFLKDRVKILKQRIASRSDECSN